MSLCNLEKDELLPFLINKHNFKKGIEIGVRDGDNLSRLLKLTGIYMYGVDIQKWPQINELESQYLHRLTFIHNDSISASVLFPDGFFDFIYIDADHKYESVLADLYAWYPKLKVGGIFAGDDYTTMWNIMEGTYGIVEAVEDFIKDKKIEFNISGLGIADKADRLEYAKRIGRLHEDNLILGAIGHMHVPQELLVDRVRTEGAPIPQWWFIKC